MATMRGRIVFVALTLFIVYFLFIGSPTTQSEKEYRQRTEDGLARRRSKLQGDISDQEWTRQTNEKLRAILETHPHGSRGAKNAEVKSAYDTVETKPAEDHEAEVPVSGRRYRHSGQNQHSDHSKPKYPKGEDQTDGSDEDVAVLDDADIPGLGERAQKGMGRTTTKGKKVEDPGKDLAREKLQEYLKKPVVIFSKTFCPHSKRAKQLLMEIYTITPAPLIVELDELTDPIADPDPDSPVTTLGVKIQGLLGEITGRRTVPNIMVGMHSIGDNGLIWDLHEAGELAATITKLVGKRVTVEFNQKSAQHDHDS